MVKTRIIPIPPQYEKLIKYLNERIEIKKKQASDYARSHDYAYATRDQEAVNECKKLLAFITGDVA